VQWASEHNIAEEERCGKFPSMEEGMPETFVELVRVKDLLQYHYRDMQVCLRFFASPGSMNLSPCAVTKVEGSFRRQKLKPDFYW
jgi:hypothetical protein